MKKRRFGVVVFSVLLVGVVVIAAGVGGLFGTTDTDTPAPSGESHSDGSDSMSVKNVSVRNRTTEGVMYLDIGVAGDIDTERLGRSMEQLYDDPRVNVSTIQLMDVQENVATVAVVTDDRSSSNHIVQRIEHYLSDGNLAEQSESDHQTEQTDDSTAEYTTVSDGQVCKVTPAYYQVDFVVGEPIEELQGPEGTYLPHELIRFAHGSSEEPITRLSDGEFITDPELSERIKSQAIKVENGTATITFSIAEGAEPLELSLVSYTKPGPKWSRATEHLQKFVDADTETFEAGGSYTLRVDLPDAETGPCKTPEPTTSATPTDTPTETTAVETPPPTQEPTATSNPTETTEPQPSGSVELDVDWLTVYNGGRHSYQDTGSTPEAIFSLKDVKPGDDGKTVLRLHNRDGPSYIRMAGDLTANDENGASEPERDVEAQPGGEGDGEIAETVDMTVYYAEYTGPGPYDVRKKQVITAGSLSEVMADLNNGIALDSNPDTDMRDSYPGSETGYLVFEWELPREVGNEIQTDSATFSLTWTAKQPQHLQQNDGRNSNER